MTPPSLPDAGPFRVFPTRATRQRFAQDATACNHCLGGTCCQSEDAIYLTAFDVLRLSTFFNLSPPEFLRIFTQERFADDPLEPYRRHILDDPDTSVVTYLRRRSNRSVSPCIFLKYVRDPDGTPRRICGVHPARPLACREYYHHHCKTRATGELASLQAHAFEMIRDGKITLDLAQAQRERLRPLLTHRAPMNAWLEYAVWTEVLRALQMEEANKEGADSYSMAEYQDPLDAKINRLLSKRRLRLEERYGWVPHGDQLQVFDGGLAFAGSPDHRRILRMVAKAPSLGLFEDGDYPFFAANRLTVSGMRRPRRFRLLAAARKRQLLRAAPAGVLFPRHRDPRVRATTAEEVWSSALDAADAFVTFAGYVAALGQVLEIEPPGTFEWEVVWFLRGLTVAKHPVLNVHPGLRQVEAWAHAALKPDAESRRRLRSMPPPRRAAPTVIRRLLDSQQPDGSWARDPEVHLLPNSQADYLRTWLHATAAGLLALQPPALIGRSAAARHADA